MGSGDIFCQALSKRDRLLEEYSLKRTLVMMTYGLLINGPSLALAYTYIYPAMGQGVRGLAYKLSFNTTIHTFISMAAFFTAIPLLKGATLKDARQECSKKWWPTVQGSWKFWPFVNVITFQMVPLAYQSQFSSLLSVVFNVYLSN